GNQYAEVLTYTFLANGGLQMTAGLFVGNPSGTMLTAIAFTNTSPVTTTFDAFSMGFRSKDNTNSTIVDLNSVQVATTAPYSGQSGGCISESVNASRILIGQTNGLVTVTLPTGATASGPLSVDLVSSDSAAAYASGAPSGTLTLAFPQNCPYTMTNVPIVAAANGTTLFYLTNATDGACIQEGASSSMVSTVLGVNAPALPLIPSGIFNITSYGAVGDGITTNTVAIQNTVNAALAAGGGTVEVPAGTFLSGPFTLGSSLRFQLDAGATLLLLPFQSYPGGTKNPTDFISDSGFHDLELCGPGIINGQGAPWWTADGGSLSTSQRPYEVHLTSGERVFIHDWNSTNPPMKNLVFDGDDYDITVQNITNTASGSSPNTDGLNLQGNRCLVQNSVFSVGDDCIAMGRSSGVGMNILITNITCKTGHGISIGSVTSAGISNVTVVNCTFNGTDYGCRIKADNDRGGLVQDVTYANITITNVQSPILIYSYYNEGQSLNVSPQLAASYGPSNVTSLTPIWRNITFSNITAYTTVDSGIIWGRPEMLASNITLTHVTINSPSSFHVYNARGVQMIDTKITPSSGSTYQIYTADLTITNDSSVTPSTSTISGLASSNSLALYDAPATITSSNLFDFSPLTLNGSFLYNSGNLALPAQSVFNYGLGTHSSLMTVGGSLSLSSTINITDGGGFSPGTYTLATYSGNLLGNVALGSVPAGYQCILETNIVGQLRLATSPLSPTINGVSLTSGGGAVISGNGGPESYGYYLLGSTNLTLPLVDWTILSTNAFDNLGNFNVTNYSQLGSQMFYRLQIP
ncbi:MAG TPA: glycosyl hydrolase family 28 protein, partial [Candidatus Acidoferrum sp.]|nr:glycosyl hydrolase family 28 protein [Candidatus Acidoferrum sp.]